MISRTTFALFAALLLAPNALGRDELLVPAQYDTLARAVMAANAGDVIVVAAGTYEDALVIATPLTIRGAGPKLTQLVLRTPTDTALMIAEGTGAVTLEGFGFACVRPGGTDAPAIHMVDGALHLTDVRFKGFRVALEAEGGAARLERVHIEENLGDALQIAGETSWRAAPGRLELHDVVVTGLSGGFGVRARDGAQVIVGGDSRVQVAVEGPASLVTDPDGAPWPDTVILGQPPADTPDEDTSSWPEEAESEATDGDDDGGEFDLASDDYDESMFEDELGDEATDSSNEPAAELPRAERIAAYRTLARELNRRLAAATGLEADAAALRGYLEALFPLGTEYGWFPLGGDEWLRAELAAFGARHGRSGFETSAASWPTPASGKAGYAGYRELYSRGFGRDFDELFLDGDLAALMVALRALQAAPTEKRGQQRIVDEFVAVQRRFHYGHAANSGAGRRIDVTLQRLDPSVAWAILREASAHEDPSARRLSSALSAETRRALLRHWSTL